MTRPDSTQSTPRPKRSQRVLHIVNRGSVVAALYLPTGFYEWKQLDEKTKQPYAIAMKDGGLFSFAGLRDTWKDKASGEELQTYTILTTDPNELSKPIHNRMPVILSRKDYSRWMAPADPAQLPVDLCQPAHSATKRTRISMYSEPDREPTFAESRMVQQSICWRV